jgi:predicted ATP-binding protein involved in virulence
MRITKLQVENFRSIQNIDFEFDYHLNVFYGVNGVGKSTILDALALMLSWVTKRTINFRSQGTHINKEYDIKNGEKYSSLRLGLKYLYNNEIHGPEFNFALHQFKAKEPESWKKYTASDLSGVHTVTHAINDRLTYENSPKANLPLFCYYRVDRVVNDVPLKIKTKHSFDIFSAYEQAFEKGSNFRLFFEWFRSKEDEENEQNSRLPEAERIFDNQLQTVRNALESFMPDFKDFRIKRKPKLRMVVSKQGEEVTIQQLSDGEKCFMALIGDLARRLAIANPNLENPLEGTGAVLIDEIDLHLHPKWQQVVVQRLRQTFPNIQFFISTHSPFVLTETKPEQLFCLKQENGEMKVETGLNTYGHTSERILEDFMGLERTRPEDVEKKFSDLYNAIHQKDKEKSFQLFEKLKEELGEDTEFNKINILLKRSFLGNNKE